MGELLRAGRKIEAIKLYREIFGVGLKEAKEAIDKLETTVDTPGAFDIHPDAPRGAIDSPRPAAGASLPSTFKPEGIRLPGCAILFALLALIVAGALLVFTASRGDNQFAAFVRRPGLLPVTATPTPTLTIAPTDTPVPPPTPAPSSTPEALTLVRIVLGGVGDDRGEFQNARTMTVDGAGRIYVGEYTGGRVQVFDPDGEYLTEWNTGGGEAPLKKLAAGPDGAIYAGFAGNIYRFDGATGEWLGTSSWWGTAIFVADEDTLLILSGPQVIELNVRR